jgi:hypothetical protein
VTNDSNIPAPVLALTILDAGTLSTASKVTAETRVLLAIRDPQTNKSHPSVISVPTQRLPTSLFHDLTSIVTREYMLDTSTELFQQIPFKNLQNNGHSNVIFAVNSILSGKMGVSDFLEQRALLYTAYLRGLVFGTVHHPDHKEFTAMLNIVVLVEMGAHLFPTRTASYSHVLWCSAGTFLETARKKNPLLLDCNLNPVEYCIHGMCVKSSFNVLADYTDSPAYPYNPYEID